MPGIAAVFFLRNENEGRWDVDEQEATLAWSPVSGKPVESWEMNPELSEFPWSSLLLRPHPTR